MNIIKKFEKERNKHKLSKKQLKKVDKLAKVLDECHELGISFQLMCNSLVALNAIAYDRLEIEDLTQDYSIVDLEDVDLIYFPTTDVVTKAFLTAMADDPEMYTKSYFKKIMENK